MVARVELFVDDFLSLGLVTNPPYALTWTNPSAGAYTVTARVTDGQDITYYSADTPVFVLSAAPSLTVSLNAGNATLQWPSEAMGYHLESTTNLSPPARWLPWTNSTPALLNNRFQITLPSASETQRFFRLAAP